MGSGMGERRKRSSSRAPMLPGLGLGLVRTRNETNERKMSFHFACFFFFLPLRFFFYCFFLLCSFLSLFFSHTFLFVFDGNCFQYADVPRAGIMVLVRGCFCGFLSPPLSSFFSLHFGQLLNDCCSSTIKCDQV